MSPVWGVIFSFFVAGCTIGPIQVNPFSFIAKVITVSMDARTKAEVTADTKISAFAAMQLLDDEGSEWVGVRMLVFAQQVVIAGAVKSQVVKKRVEEVVRRDKTILYFSNELLVGNLGSFAPDTVLEAEINATLTAEPDVLSVNMRWSATGGQVVLMGVAGSRQEANLAASKVRGIKGVKNLISRLRVVPAKN
jgi:osmotically-inducible protein OsmY